MEQHPQVPWVRWGQQVDGSIVLVNDRTGQQVVVSSPLQAHQVAASWASAPGRMGLGDAVKAATQRLGIRQCSPCAQRQAAMNRWVPNIGWRR